MNVQKISKALIVLLVLLSVFFVGRIMLTLQEMRYVGTDVYPARTITVAGEGEVFAVADIAEISFSVTAEAKTMESAQANVSGRVNTALGVLESYNIDEKDIKTVAYNAYPRYEYNNDTAARFPTPEGSRELVAYEVTQTITVKVRNTDTVGEIIGALGDAKISNLSGPNFTIDDDEVLQEEARSLAIADAHTKAVALANDLGVRLGKVVNFQRNGGVQPYFFEESAMGAPRASSDAAQPQLPVGENTIRSMVSVTYEIR